MECTEEINGMMERSRSSEIQPLDPNNLGGWKQMSASSSRNSLRSEDCRGRLEMNSTKGLLTGLYESSPNNYIDISSSPRIAETPISDSNANFSFPSDGDVGLPESCSSTHLLEDEIQFSFKKPMRRTRLLSKFKFASRACSSCFDPCQSGDRLRSDYHYTSKQCLVKIALALRLPGLIFSFFIIFIILCVYSGLKTYGDDKVMSSTSADEENWWRCSVMYEIFPASFADTNDDGFGDINGVIEHLDYLKHLGVDVIRLGSIFSALDYPVRYKHVIDFNNMDPHLGKLTDFEKLIDEAHSRGIRIVLDINPTVTSDQHPWAAHWMLNNNGDYKGFFASAAQDLRKMKIIEENGTLTAWLHVDGAWREPIRGFGGHALLNWSNAYVKTKMEQSFRFWLGKGVDGFNMKSVENMYTDNDEDFLQAVKDWRRILDDCSESSGKRRVMIGANPFMENVSEGRWDILSEMLDNFDVIDVRLEMNDSSVLMQSYERIQTVDKSLNHGVVNVFADNVDNERVATKVGKKLNEGLLIILMMLPSPVTFLYGQETSLTDAKDPNSNQIIEDGQLAAMIWPDSPSEVTSWLPSPSSSNHTEVNTSREFDMNTNVARLRLLSRLRKSDQLCDSPVSEIMLCESDLMILKVVSKVTQEFLVFINFGSHATYVDQKRRFIDFHSVLVKVITCNTNRFRPNQLLNVNDIVVHSQEVVVTQLYQCVSGNLDSNLVVDASDYNNVYGYLSLGDCPTRNVLKNGIQEPLECPFDYEGEELMIRHQITRVDYKRIKSTSSALDFLDITIGAGVSFMGLVGASVSVRVATTVKRKSSTLVLAGQVDTTRGLKTFKGQIKPVRPLDPRFPTQVYVSHILIGAKESLIVELDFESESRKRVVEVTISIKLLFFTISKTMRFVKEKFDGASSVKIKHISSMGNIDATFQFTGLGTFDAAIAKVEQLENRMKALPEIIKRKRDRELHLKYYFKFWDNSSFMAKINWNRVNFDLKRLAYQEAELTSILEKISDYTTTGLPKNVLKPLEDYQTELSDKKNKLMIAQKNYFSVSEQERLAFADIFGRSKASGYYTRKFYRLIPF